MPRKALKCVSDVKIHSVSCPGVWLQSRDELHLSITLFGIHYHTKLLGPAFPVFIFEKFRFEKMFPSCADPADVATHLEGEELYLELIQETYQGAGEVVLATYWSNAREFLFPHPSCRPTYSDSERELLMVKTMHFPGIIAPKIEFSTSTVIKESSKLSSGRRRCLSQSQGNLSRESIYADKKLPKDDDLQFYCTCRERYSPKQKKRAPFVVRRVDSKLISRTPSSYPQRTVSKRRAVSSSPPPMSRVTKWEQSCTVCRLYKKYFGGQYVGHHHPPFSDRSCSCNASPVVPNLESLSSDERDDDVDRKYNVTSTRPKSAQVYYRNTQQGNLPANHWQKQVYGNQQQNNTSSSSKESSDNKSSSDSPKEVDFASRMASYDHREAFQRNLINAYEDLYNQATSTWIDDC